MCHHRDSNITSSSVVFGWSLVPLCRLSTGTDRTCRYTTKTNKNSLTSPYHNTHTHTPRTKRCPGFRVTLKGKLESSDGGGLLRNVPQTWREEEGVSQDPRQHLSLGLLQLPLTPPPTPPGWNMLWVLTWRVLTPGLNQLEAERERRCDSSTVGPSCSISPGAAAHLTTTIPGSPHDKTGF